MKKQILGHISTIQPLTEELKEFIIMQQVKKKQKKIAKNRILQFNLRMMNTTFEQYVRDKIKELIERPKRPYVDNNILDFIDTVSLAYILSYDTLEIRKGPKKYAELSEEDQVTIDTIISTVDINMAATSKTLDLTLYFITFSENYEVMTFTIKDIKKRKNEDIVVSLNFQLNDNLRHFVMNAIFNGEHVVQPRYRILSECAFFVETHVTDEE